MAEYYKIGTKLGYDLASGLQPGQSVTATDGSVWTKNTDGTISVLHNGVQKIGQLDYQPTGTQGAAPMGYQSPYAEQLQATMAELGNSQWQGWNKDEDESYQAYRKAYLREADRTMQDTLGQYAQNTGGIAGSSAINAASQAADYYKSQLNDKVPELYDAAYNRYLNDLAMKQQQVNMLMNAENQNANLHYQQLNYAMQKWAQMGYADAEVAGILGVAQGTLTSDQAYTDWSKSFGGGGGGAPVGDEFDLSTADMATLWSIAEQSGDVDSWISRNWKAAGFSSQEDARDAYDRYLESGAVPPTNPNETIGGYTQQHISDYLVEIISGNELSALNEKWMRAQINSYFKTPEAREAALAVYFDWLEKHRYG